MCGDREGESKDEGRGKGETVDIARKITRKILSSQWAHAVHVRVQSYIEQNVSGRVNLSSVP